MGKQTEHGLQRVFLEVADLLGGKQRTLVLGMAGLPADAAFVLAFRRRRLGRLQREG